MVKTKGKRPSIDYSKGRKGKTVPDQSMDIKELVRRYVKGVPADVVQREKTYLPDNNEEDFEALGRLDPTDRAYAAQQRRLQAEQLGAQAKEEVQAIEGARERNEQERQNARQETEQHSNTLDNTMLDDTELDSRPLPKPRPGKQRSSKNAQ